MVPRHAAIRLSLAASILMCALPTAAGGPETRESLIRDIRHSGRLSMIGVRSSERLRPVARLAPGDPPVLAFRYLEDRRRHRFGELDLMMDDAGH